MSWARKRAVGCCIHTSIVIRDSLTAVARYGPDTGKLEVHTYREGVAAKVGHDLIIEVTKWAGQRRRRRARADRRPDARSSCARATAASSR